MPLQTRLKLAVGLWLAAMLAVVCTVFWQNELIYSLPTPIPQDHKEIALGSTPQLAGLVRKNANKPLLLHFFNPECPCSRFNIKHFQSLVRTYGDRMDFAIVALSDDKELSAQSIRERFNLELPVYQNEAIAEICGVIATPQAVILDASGKLFYRGNYNKSRYCTDPQTDFARMAIDSLLRHPKARPALDADALVAYGCALPGSSTCKKPGS